MKNFDMRSDSYVVNVKNASVDTSLCSELVGKRVDIYLIADGLRDFQMLLIVDGLAREEQGGCEIGFGLVIVGGPRGKL
jgi:hypothetical protein